MKGIKNWIKYTELLHEPEKYGVESPYELRVSYHPMVDDDSINHFYDKIPTQDIISIKRIVEYERSYGYYPIGELDGKIFLTTAKIADDVVFQDLFDIYNQHMLELYACLHNNACLNAFGVQWNDEYTEKLLSMMPIFLKQLPTAFFTSITFDDRDDFMTTFGFYAVVSGHLSKFPCLTSRCTHIVCQNTWGLSLRPLITVPNNILISSKDLVKGSSLRLKLPGSRTGFQFFKNLIKPCN